jgi:hypothetical protein
MYYLAILFPWLEERRLPLSRDQLLLLLAAVNLLFLGLDTYLAHLISGTIRPREWIPVVFGFVAGILLLVAGLIALRNRSLATRLVSVVFIASITVGLLGAYFHVVRGTYPTAPAGQRVSVNLLVWAPPVVAPLMFALVGLWGISAAWLENPPDSGRLDLGGGRFLQLPYSKTRAYLFMTSLAILATIVSGALDHARVNYENPWVWLPLFAGIFATIVTFGLALLRRPSRADMAIFVGTMAAMIVVGLLGAVLHVRADISGQTIVIERFLREAPFLAPLLFANMGLLGLIVVLDPVEQVADEGAPMALPA